MAKKTQFTKLDIVRWVVVLPVTIITLLIYGEFSSWLNKVYLVNFHGDGNSFFTVYIDCVAIPSLILGCSYFISPRFKFKSALVLISFFALTTIHALQTNEYLKHQFNLFILLYFLTASLGLYRIYQIENKK
jgi:hypothetical protein